MCRVSQSCWQTPPETPPSVPSWNQTPRAPSRRRKSPIWRSSLEWCSATRISLCTLCVMITFQGSTLFHVLYVCLCVHTCNFLCVCVTVCVCVFLYVCMCIHMCIFVSVYVSPLCVFVCATVRACVLIHLHMRVCHCVCMHHRFKLLWKLSLPSRSSF